jgi:hypothetical protein
MIRSKATRQGNASPQNRSKIERFGRKVCHALESSTRKVSRWEWEITILTGIFILLSGVAWILGSEAIYHRLKSLIELLKYFALPITVLLGLSLLFARLGKPHKEIGCIKDLSETIDRVREISTPSFTVKTATRKDVPSIAILADEEFGSEFIPLTKRQILFFVWNAIHRNCMSLLKYKEQTIGYLIVLPLHATSAQHIMLGELSQFNLSYGDILQKSQSLFIQSVCVTHKSRLATIALFRQLSTTIEAMIAEPHDPVTLFFVEYSDHSARLAKNHGFEKLKTNSFEGHAIWRLTIEGRLISSKSNIVPFFSSSDVAEDEREAA